MSAFYEAALPAAAIFLILAAAYRAAHKPRTQTPRPASCPSTGAGRGRDHCTQRGCPGEGLFWVMADGDSARRLVCWFCLREGFTKGWWVTFYRADGNEWVCASCGDRVPRWRPDVYDQELTDRDFREVMDDARRITREAAGGATA